MIENRAIRHEIQPIRPFCELDTLVNGKNECAQCLSSGIGASQKAVLLKISARVDNRRK